MGSCLLKDGFDDIGISTFRDMFDLVSGKLAKFDTSPDCKALWCSTMEISGGTKPYAEMDHDEEISAMYRRNSEALGREFPDLGALMERAAASTDMGNVSLVLPAIHPMIGALPLDREVV